MSCFSALINCIFIYRYASYDPVTGIGALGVEFAGTAVTSGSSFGSLAPPAADNRSAILVAANAPLQWSEGYYRGFFTLTISPEWMNATYYAMRNISELFIHVNDVEADSL